jgi:hypothetical protein
VRLEEAKKMTKLEHTDEAFGSIRFDLDERYVEDELDRDAIWEESGHDYATQQHVYMGIAEGLFEDHPDFDELVFEAQDFGVRVLLPDTGEWFYLGSISGDG